MANSDAIKFLGETLVSILETGLNGLVPGGNVKLSTPDDVQAKTPDSPSVTVFLYHVGICGEMRNMPRRTLSKGEVQRPPLPLDLRFLITPWTEEPQEAYQIIGAIAQILYDRSTLGFGDLQGEEVWRSDDTVEIMMESLPVEQHYDIWEPTGLPYRLSLAYLARVIGIDSALKSRPVPVIQANIRRA